MKIERLLRIVVLLGCVSATFGAVALTEDFKGGPLTTFTVLGGGRATGTFDGAGHYVMTQDAYIYRNVNAGDFSSQVVMSSIDLGSPTEPNQANNRRFYYLLNHSGDGSEMINLFFFKNSLVTQFAVDKTIDGVTSRVYTETLSSLSSAKIRLVWNETLKTYSVYLAVNGGTLAGKVSVPGFSASSTNRTEYFYGEYAGTLEAGKPSVSLDSYVMESNPAAQGQIDSMDSIMSWTEADSPTANPTPLMVSDSTKYLEGTGSMRIKFEEGTYSDPPVDESGTWHVTSTRTVSLNLATIQPLAFTCKFYTDYSGWEELHQIIVTQGGHVARYTVPRTNVAGWHTVNAPISQFVYDGNSFNWAAVDHIQFWCSTWDVPGNSIYIDDLRLGPCDMLLDSMDNIAGTNNHSKWNDAYNTGLMVQSSTFSHDGGGAIEIKYGQTTTAWNVVPWRNFQYVDPPTSPAPYNNQLDMTNPASNTITLWIYNDAQSGKAKLNQIILYSYAGGNAARYTVPTFSTTGWNQVVAPRWAFVLDTPSGAFYWYGIQRMDLWTTTWDTRGTSSLFLDDMHLIGTAEPVADPSPVPPYQIASFDSFATDGWSDSRSTGLVSQETTTKHEGTGSLKINFTQTQTSQFDAVPRKTFSTMQNWSNYQNWALSIWIYSDLVNDSRLNQIIIYDNNAPSMHTGRYTIPGGSTPGWRQVIAPLDQFVWDNGVTAAQVKWDSIKMIDLWASCYLKPGNAVYLDDFQIIAKPAIPSQAYVINAQKATITVDGNPSDWASLTDSDPEYFNLAATPWQPHGNLNVQYKLAWDDNYLYMLVQEQPGDETATEAANLAAMTAAGGDVKYDSLALFFDFTNSHLPGVSSDISLWLFLGLSSTNRSDLEIAWTNGHWGGNDANATANSAVATSGTRGSRVIEAKLKWSSLASTIQAVRLPAGGLLSAIKPGYVFGCDPRLNDLDGADPNGSGFTSNKGAAWLDGKTWSNFPSGKDGYSVDVRLVCKAADINGDCKVDFADYARLSQQWLSMGCNDLNGYCSGADIYTEGNVDMMDLRMLAQDWLKQ